MPTGLQRPGTLEKGLAEAQWNAGPSPTVADLALYPYTRWMDEVGFALEDWRTIKLWINRFENLSRFLTLYADAATAMIEFADYFGPPAATTPAARPD
jgi:glutathione S-transferase